MRQEPNARRLRRNPRTTRSWADGALDGVVVEFDAAVFDEARQALPARQGVSDGLGKLAFLAVRPRFKRSHGSSAAITGQCVAWHDRIRSYSRAICDGFDAAISLAQG